MLGFLFGFVTGVLMSILVMYIIYKRITGNLF